MSKQRCFHNVFAQKTQKQHYDLYDKSICLLLCFAAAFCIFDPENAKSEHPKTIILRMHLGNRNRKGKKRRPANTEDHHPANAPM